MASHSKTSFRPTLVALGAAIVLGLLLRLLGFAEINGALTGYLLEPLKTIFLRALKLVVVPVVFFMISSSVAGISDLRTYGCIGTKIILTYLFTSMAAIVVGIGLACLFRPGEDVSMTLVNAGYTAEPAAVSLMDTLVNIVPANIMAPFVEADMIQLIFLAVLVGAAAGLLGGEDHVRIQEILNLLNRLFLKIASLVLKLIPQGTFCAVVLLLLEIDGDTLLGLLKLMGTVFLGAVIMMVLYALLFLAATGKNPLRLMRKCLPNYLSFALLCSTSAVMLQTLDTCTNRLGIDPEVSSFSMPLGSTMNMDGACVYLTVSALFLAEIYGIELTAGELLNLAVTTLLLSVGAPPVPGAGFVCLSVLVLQLGLPINSVGFLLGIDQFMSMCRTVINGAGDIVVTALVACREGRMDEGVFDAD